MRVRSTLAALVLALPLALGCSDESDLTTGPAGDLADLEQLQISAPSAQRFKRLANRSGPSSRRSVPASCHAKRHGSRSRPCTRS
jgi:hypothetical protein